MPTLTATTVGTCVVVTVLPSAVRRSPVPSPSRRRSLQTAGYPRPVPRVLVAVVAVLAVLGAACSGGTDRAVDSRNRSVARHRAASTTPPRSVVQLGDSIASGEGT